MANIKNKLKKQKLVILGVFSSLIVSAATSATVYAAEVEEMDEAAIAVTTESSEDDAAVAASIERTDETEYMTDEELEAAMLEGDAPCYSFTNPGVKIGENVGSVTVKANIPWNIHEMAYVTLTEMNTGEDYAVYLFEANGFESTINVPAGVYVTGGGLSADTTGRFRMTEVYFNANAYSNTAVIVDLIDHNDELKAAEEKKKLNDEVVPSKLTKEDAESDTSVAEKEDNEEEDTSFISKALSNWNSDPVENDKDDYKSMIFTLLINTALFGLGAAVYLYYKKKEKHKDDF